MKQLFLITLTSVWAGIMVCAGQQPQRPALLLRQKQEYLAAKQLLELQKQAVLAQSSSFLSRAVRRQLQEQPKTLILSPSVSPQVLQQSESTNLRQPAPKRLRQANKAHECPQYPQTFTQKSSLTRHARAIHKIKSKVSSKENRSEQSTPSPTSTYCSSRAVKEQPGPLSLSPSLSPQILQQSEPSSESSDDETNLRQTVPKRLRQAKKTHKCPKCQKIFPQKGSLSRHVKSVHEKVRYKCTQCSQTFTQKNNLSPHVKSAHQGVRHPCPQCTQTFTYQTSLNEHVKSAHEKVRHKCSQCTQTFTQKSSLNKHKKTQHKDKSKN